MWKATTRDQSISWWATRPARNSFWLGAAAKTTFARPAAPLPLGDLPRHVAGRGPARQGPRLEDQDFQGIHDKSRDRRRLGEAHDRHPGARDRDEVRRNRSGRGDSRETVPARTYPIPRADANLAAADRPDPTVAGSDRRSGRRELARRAAGRVRRSGAARRASGTDPGRRAWTRSGTTAWSPSLAHWSWSWHCDMCSIRSFIQSSV